MQRRPAVLVTIAATAAISGCGGQQRTPTTDAPSDARFSVGSEAMPTPGESRCPKKPKKPKLEGRKRSVRVADTTKKRGATPKRLETASDMAVTCIRWRRWGGEQAVGTGIADGQTCLPTCAGGTRSRQLARVWLSEPKKCGKRVWYTKAKVVIPGAEKQPAAYLDPPC